MNELGKTVLQTLENAIEETNRVINEQIVAGFIIKTAKNLKETFFKGVKSGVVESNSCDDIVKKAHESNWGVYMFMLKLDEESQVEEFKADWQEFKDSLGKKVPALRKGGIPYNEKKGNKFRYSLYIGKSNKLSSRLEEHIKGSDSNSSTYFLRLKDFEKFTKLKGRNYVVEIVYLYSDKVEVSHAIPFIEKKLHKNFTPLLGTAR